MDTKAGEHLLEPDPGRLRQSSEFLYKSIIGHALGALVFLLPFAINNFVQGRPFLGTGATAIVLLLVFNAWSVYARGRYYSTLLLLGLVPLVILFLVLSLDRQGVIGLLWCYPAVVTLYFLLPERKAWIANAIFLFIVLPAIWQLFDHAIATRALATLLGLSFFCIIFIRVITDQQNRLQMLAATDPLTGTRNRTLLDSTLERAIQQSLRSGVPMTLLALDIDHFKDINDTYGHDTGDRVLRDFAALLQARLRRGDQVFRVGGEEFLSLLYGTDTEDACRVAEGLRESVSALSLLPDRSVTVSIGVATHRAAEEAAAWLKRSDENLYLAKTSGRNRVVHR